jgi:L-amino acid N-acyltransferase YncA
MKNIEEITIRPVTEADAEKLLSIYAPYVTDTFITYEYTVPTVEEFRERIRNTLQAYPYFAAVENGRIIGYAYASAFHPRRAYLWSAEATVYLERGVRGRGVGRLLYERLEETLKQQNVQNVNACIAYPNPQSIAFHEKMGYAIVGTFHRCAFKFNKCYHMVWLEKILTQTDTTPLPVIPFSQLDKALINKIVLE